MANLFLKGGPLMYPILLGSVVGFAIMIDKLIQFRRILRELDIPISDILRREAKPDLRIYQCSDCPECKRKWECTRAEYRTISLDPREYLMQTMRARLATKEGKKKYGRRKCLVEPVFGDMKYNRNMRGVLLRGKLKAKGEFLIMCIAHNLKKIANYSVPILHF